MPDNEYTTIRVSVKTRDRLAAEGKMGDDFEAVLTRMLDERETKARQ